MQYCAEHGIPHSTFLAWDPADRGKALAYLIEKAARCQMCGTAEWEWDSAQGGKRFAYEAVTHVCPGCYVKESSAEHLERAPGQTVQLAPTGDQEHAKRQLREEALWRAGRQ